MAARSSGCTTFSRISFVHLDQSHCTRNTQYNRKPSPGMRRLTAPSSSERMLLSEHCRQRGTNLSHFYDILHT